MSGTGGSQPVSSLGRDRRDDQTAAFTAGRFCFSSDRLRLIRTDRALRRFPTGACTAVRPGVVASHHANGRNSLPEQGLAFGVDRVECDDRRPQYRHRYPNRDHGRRAPDSPAARLRRCARRTSPRRPDVREARRAARPFPAAWFCIMVSKTALKLVERLLPRGTLCLDRIAMPESLFDCTAICALPAPLA